MADDNVVAISLSRDEALVLFEWLARTGSAENPANFEDQAEQRVLWDIGAMLESVLSEPFREDYAELLVAARTRVRDPDR